MSDIEKDILRVLEENPEYFDAKEKLREIGRAQREIEKYTKAVESEIKSLCEDVDMDDDRINIETAAGAMITVYPGRVMERLRKDIPIDVQAAFAEIKDDVMETIRYSPTIRIKLAV